MTTLFSIQVSEGTYRRFMQLVNPLLSPDEALCRLLDRQGIPSLEPSTKVGAASQQNFSTPAEPEKRVLSDGKSGAPTAPESLDADAPVIRRRVVRTGVRLQFEGKAPRGESLGREQYARAILAVLSEHGGRASTEVVQQRLGVLLKERFSDIDLAPLPKNRREVRWWNHARFAREWLVERRHLLRDAPKGEWHLHPDAYRIAARLRANLKDKTVVL